MVLEQDPVAFIEYLPAAFGGFLAKGAILAGVGLVFAFIMLGARFGPVVALQSIGDFLKNAFRDLFHFSPRRVTALAGLAVREALRRRVLIVFGIFAALLLFGGWFLGFDNREPAKLYLNFVLSWTMFLVLLLALFLSTMSLPADFKSRTIQTITTKPVHSGEIVLGRILGFSLVGTVLLAAMGICSYIFVVRAFQHTHELTEADLRTVSGSAGKPGTIAKTGTTGETMKHTHDVSLDAEGNGWTSVSQGHRHPITAHKEGDKLTYVVGPPEELLVARVPVYGKLRFKDRTGEDKQRGISVGSEWTYRSFVDGAPVPLAAAIWEFSDVSEERFPDGLPVEMTIRSFRTHKGDIEKGLRAILFVRNPITGKKSQAIHFRVKDSVLDRITIPRQLLDEEGKPIDLFKDIVAPELTLSASEAPLDATGKPPASPQGAPPTVVHGAVEVWLQCLDNQQYIGVAKADLYLRAEDASFEWNFAKGYLGIWMSMILVTSFGVVCGTFLSAPVALMATAALILLGFFTDKVVNLADSVLYPETVKRENLIPGGGPLESMIRIVEQKNQMEKLKETRGVQIAQRIDEGVMHFMRATAQILPDYSQFNNADYVVQGFQIPGDRVLIQFLRTLGYTIVVLIAGYLFLKTRETAR